MSLVFHQLGLEIRRSFGLLVVYSLMLFGGFCAAAGWVGLPVFDPLRGGWSPAAMLPGLLWIGQLVLFVLLVVSVVAADSPAAREGFLASRPMPRRALLLAKGLYLLITVVMPATLVEWASLKYAGADVVFEGTLERFVLSMVAALFLALFCAHWKTMFSSILGGAVMTGLGVGIVSLAGLVSPLVGGPVHGLVARISSVTGLAVLVAVLGVCAGLAVTIGMNARKQWGVPKRVMWFGLLILGGLALALAVPESSLRRLKADEDGGLKERLTAAIANTRFEDSYLTESIFHDRNNRDLLHVRCMVNPVVEGLPEELELRWICRKSILSQGGRVLGKSSLPYFRDQPGTVTSERSLRAAIRREVGPFRFLARDRHRGYSGEEALSVGQFVDQEGQLTDEPMSFESSLEVEAFQWGLEAELSLKPGSQAGRWRLSEVGRDGPELKLYTQWTGFGLHGVRRVDGNERPASRTFVLHIPARDFVWISGVRFQNEVPGLSSVKHYFMEIPFGGQGREIEPFTESELLDARLLVFQPRFLARVEGSYRSPQLALGFQQTHGPLELIRRDEGKQTSPAVFASWLEECESEERSFNREEFRSFLKGFLNQAMHSGEYFGNPHCPSVAYLSTFVAEHGEVFLEYLKGVSSRHTLAELLVSSIVAGAEEEQRLAILSSLPEAPILLDIVLRRGWLEDARTQLVDLHARYPSWTGQLGALLFFDDPELDALVLESFRSQPRVEVYLMLRRIPRLRKALEDVASGLWEPGPVILGDQMDPALEIAVAQGRREALEHFIESMKQERTHGSRAWRAGEMIKRGFVLPKALAKESHHSSKLIAWLVKHRASDFRFDHVVERFVLVNSDQN